MRCPTQVRCLRRRLFRKGIRVSSEVAAELCGKPSVQAGIRRLHHGRNSTDLVRGVGRCSPISSGSPALLDSQLSEKPEPVLAPFCPTPFEVPSHPSSTGVPLPTVAAAAPASASPKAIAALSPAPPPTPTAAIVAASAVASQKAVAALPSTPPLNEAVSIGRPGTNTFLQSDIRLSESLISITALGQSFKRLHLPSVDIPQFSVDIPQFSMDVPQFSLPSLMPVSGSHHWQSPIRPVPMRALAINTDPAQSSVPSSHGLADAISSLTSAVMSLASSIANHPIPNMTASALQLQPPVPQRDIPLNKRDRKRSEPPSQVTLLIRSKRDLLHIGPVKRLISDLKAYQSLPNARDRTNILRKYSDDSRRAHFVYSSIGLELVSASGKDNNCFPQSLCLALMGLEDESFALFIRSKIVEVLHGLIQSDLSNIEISLLLGLQSVEDHVIDTLERLINSNNSDMFDLTMIRALLILLPELVIDISTMTPELEDGVANRQSSVVPTVMRLVSPMVRALYPGSESSAAPIPPGCFGIALHRFTRHYGAALRLPPPGAIAPQQPPLLCIPLFTAEALATRMQPPQRMLRDTFLSQLRFLRDSEYFLDIHGDLEPNPVQSPEARQLALTEARTAGLFMFEPPYGLPPYSGLGSVNQPAALLPRPIAIANAVSRRSVPPACSAAAAPPALALHPLIATTQEAPLCLAGGVGNLSSSQSRETLIPSTVNPTTPSEPSIAPATSLLRHCSNLQCNSEFHPLSDSDPPLPHVDLSLCRTCRSRVVPVPVRPPTSKGKKKNNSLNDKPVVSRPPQQQDVYLVTSTPGGASHSLAVRDGRRFTGDVEGLLAAITDDNGTALQPFIDRCCSSTSGDLGSLISNGFSRDLSNATGTAVFEFTIPPMRDSYTLSPQSVLQNVPTHRRPHELSIIAFGIAWRNPAQRADGAEFIVRLDHIGSSLKRRPAWASDAPLLHGPPLVRVTSNSPTVPTVKSTAPPPSTGSSDQPSFDPLVVGDIASLSSPSSGALQTSLCSTTKSGLNAPVLLKRVQSPNSQRRRVNNAKSRLMISGLLPAPSVNAPAVVPLHGPNSPASSVSQQPQTVAAIHPLVRK